MRYLFQIVTSLILFFFFAPSTGWTQHLKIYVSTKGNDQHEGTLKSPVATLSGALNIVKKSSDKQEVAIMIMRGEYYFERSVALSEKEFGQRKITISNYRNDKVVFTGGVHLKSNDFIPVTDQEELNRLPEEVRSHVVVIDLKSHGITDYGKIIPHGFNRKVEPTPLELYFDGEPLTIARWPNNDMVKIGKVLERGAKPSETNSVGVKPVFQFDYDRAARWKKANNICISGMFTYGYADDNMPIESIDFDARTITLAAPASYPIYASDDDKTDNPAVNYATFQRKYFVYNLLEEIDMPGEWFMDNENGKLYLYPPKPVMSSDIEISMLKQPFIEIQDIKDVHLKGINFKCSRSSGLIMQNVQSATITDCNFYNLGMVAIMMEEKSDGMFPNKDVSISFCNAWNTGTGAFFLEGGDRKTLTPGNISISNCEIHHFNRLNHTYSPAVNMGGVGNTISHCYLHDATHLAIAFSGNDHVIEYNHFKNLCKDASDMGVIYTGRNPSARGTLIANNFFENIVAEDGYSIAGVYIDDGSGGMKVENNIFYRAGSIGAHNFGAVNMNGGYNNYFRNNVFIDCERAFSYNQWGDDNYTKIINSPLYQSRMFKEVDIYSTVYLKAYPELKDFMKVTKIEDRRNFSFNTVVVGNGELSRGTQFVNTDFIVSKTNPGFKDLNNKNFAIQKGSEIAKKLRDFKAIDFQKIGIQTKK
jgi:hypothetical protein